jgi:hypothetical protein
MTPLFLVRPTLAAAFAAAALTLPTVASADPKELVVVLGAIHDPANAQYATAPVDKSAPALPVVYEAKKADAASAGAAKS